MVRFPLLDKDCGFSVRWNSPAHVKTQAEPPLTCCCWWRPYLQGRRGAQEGEESAELSDRGNGRGAGCVRTCNHPISHPTTHPRPPLAARRRACGRQPTALHARCGTAAEKSSPLRLWRTDGGPLQLSPQAGLAAVETGSQGPRPSRTDSSCTIRRARPRPVRTRRQERCCPAPANTPASRI